MDFLDFGFTITTSYIILVIAAIALGVTGSVYGLGPNNPKGRSGQRLYDAGIASVIGVLFSWCCPVLGIIGGSLAITWRNDG